MLLLGNLLWGVSFPLIKSLVLLQERLVPGGSSWFITASTMLPRFTFGALVLGLICFRAVRTLTRSEFRQGLGLGLFALAGMIFQNDGLQFTSASTSAFLTQFYAIMIPAWLALRARRSPSWVVWLCGALALAGMAVLARLDWHDLKLGRGEWETLISSVFYMGQILWLGRPEFAANRALPVTTLMFVVLATGSGVMSVALAPAGGAHAGAMDGPDVAGLHADPDGRLHAGRVHDHEQVAAIHHDDRGGPAVLLRAGFHGPAGAVPAGVVFALGRVELFE